jgi:hypothetical protein
MFLAWIRGSEIVVRKPEGDTFVVNSPHAARAREHHASILRRRAWKTEGTGAQFMRGGAPAEPVAEGPMHVQPLRLARGLAPGELVYLLHWDTTSGAFRVDLHDDVSASERRIRHGDPLMVDVCADPRGDGFLFACPDMGGMSLGAMGPFGARADTITEGQASDTEPSPVPGAPAVLYVSRGLASDASGVARSRGPAEVLRLDLSTGEVTTVLSEPGFDHRSPKQTADGTLYVLRAPRPKPRPRAAPRAEWVEILLFPWTLVRGFAMTVFFLFAPVLVRLGMPPAWFVQRSQAHEAPVPVVWELIRVRGGQTDVVATPVTGFDAAPDGTLVWSDGEAVFQQMDGETTKVVDEPEVQVLALV